MTTGSIRTTEPVAIATDQVHLANLGKLGPDRVQIYMPRFCILMYHMVNEPSVVEQRRYAVPPRRFASHMNALRENSYNPVSLTDVQTYLEGGAELPKHAVVVTLDDGYADNYTSALPILQRYEIPATVFLTVSAVGGENDWMRGSSSFRHRMLDWRQIREMHASGIGFGSHTLSHPRLSTLGRNTARDEIQGAKKALEDKLGTTIGHFAYPYGDWSLETVELVREVGHTLACSTCSGFNRRDADPLLLRRIDVSGTDRTWKLLQKLRFGTNESGITLQARYYWERVIDKVKSRRVHGSKPF